METAGRMLAGFSSTGAKAAPLGGSGGSGIEARGPLADELAGLLSELSELEQMLLETARRVHGNPTNDLLRGLGPQGPIAGMRDIVAVARKNVVGMRAMLSGVLDAL